MIPKKSGEKPVSTDYITEWRDFMSTQPFGNVYEWLQHIGAENKQGNITAAGALALASIATSGPWPSGYYWVAADNSQQAMSAADTLAFAQNIGTYVTGLLLADRKSTRLNSSHMSESRMPSSA